MSFKYLLIIGSILLFGIQTKAEQTLLGTKWFVQTEVVICGDFDRKLGKANTEQLVRDSINDWTLVAGPSLPWFYAGQMQDCNTPVNSGGRIGIYFNSSATNMHGEGGLAEFEGVEKENRAPDGGPYSGNGPYYRGALVGRIDMAPIQRGDVARYVLTHEFGHILGFNHYGGVMLVGGDTTLPAAFPGVSIIANVDVQKIRSIYGSSGTPETSPCAQIVRPFAVFTENMVEIDGRETKAFELSIKNQTDIGCKTSQKYNISFLLGSEGNLPIKVSLPESITIDAGQTESIDVIVNLTRAATGSRSVSVIIKPEGAYDIQTDHSATLFLTSTGTMAQINYAVRFAGTVSPVGLLGDQLAVSGKLTSNDVALAGKIVQFVVRRSIDGKKKVLRAKTDANGVATAYFPIVKATKLGGYNVKLEYHGPKQAFAESSSIQSFEVR